MRILIIGALLVSGVLSILNSHQVESSVVQNTTQVAPVLLIDKNIPPEISAKAYGVFDVETGELLLSHNEDESLPIASVTKLFTAAAVLEANRDDEALTVTASDVATEGRAGKLEAGQAYQPRELLFPLLLESSNDAAATLERMLGAIPFAGKSLADASGLSSNNRATVEELADEVRKMYLTDPEVFDITRLKQHIGEHTGWVNNSPVRDLPGYRGGKHGYTLAANRTLAAVFAEPTLGDRELGYIILGSDDLRADTIALRSSIEDSVHFE